MNKVKVLRNDDGVGLELDINNFIKDKKLVDIKISTDVTNQPFEGTKIWTTVIIIYEDGPSQADKETSAQIDAAYLEVM